ncbi:MAG: hypothetical protein AB1428_09540 [Bacteroidota bacterium]
MLRVFRTWCVAALSAVSIAGCIGDVYTVHSRDGESLLRKEAGVPFYTVRGGTRQTTAWLEEYYHIQLVTVDRPGASTPADTILRLDKDVLSAGFAARYRELQELAAGAAGDDSVYRALLNAIDRLTPHDRLHMPPAESLVLLYNELEAESYVDYSRTYFLSGETPILGSANLSLQLNPDGTLAKGEGKAESRALESVLSSVVTPLLGQVPLREFLTTHLMPAAAAKRTGQGVRSVHLAASLRRVVHQRTMLHRSQLDRAEPLRLTDGAGPGSYRRIEQSPPEDRSKDQ